MKIGYIDTSDKIDRDQHLVNCIFALLDSIEHKLGNDIMAHQIPEIKDDLKSWQDRTLKDLYFYNRLTKFWDSINK